MTMIKIAYYFRDLFINIYNYCMAEPELLYIELGQFYTSFYQLRGFNSITVVNILADNALKYQITLSDETFLYITVFTPNVFNSSIDSQYNDTEFKELFIDSDALTQSTDDISQLKVLQQLNTSVQLNKNTAGLKKFIFE